MYICLTYGCHCGQRVPAEADSLEDVCGVVEDVWLAAELLESHQHKANECSPSHVFL